MAVILPVTRDPVQLHAEIVLSWRKSLTSRLENKIIKVKYFQPD